MSLRHHSVPTQRAMRASVHGILAVIGVVLLGTGLALVSGLMQSRQPNAATALVMVQPLQHAESSRAAVAPLPQPTPQVPVHGIPRAEEPPRREGRPQPEPKRRASGAGPRVAVVIDDIGHALEVTERFLTLAYPLTYSVLPDVPFARASAERIRAGGREYIIHLPMQPLDYPAQDPGPRALLLSQSLSDTEQILRGYLQVLPDAVGASNHMGSAYTGDELHMAAVQSVLAEHRLFFLNSRTSGTPIPATLARRWGYAYAQRDVFLDHDPDAASIERAWQQTLRQARRQGQAIAIGHPYDQTWEMLRRNLPRLAEEGIELVPLSQLVER